MGSRERYLVGLDIGTSKVAAIVAETMDDGSLEVVRQFTYRDFKERLS